MSIKRELIPKEQDVAGLANTLGIDYQDAEELETLSLCQKWLDRRGDERSVVYALINLLERRINQRIHQSLRYEEFES